MIVGTKSGREAKETLLPISLVSLQVHHLRAFLHAEVHQTRNERLWILERFQHLLDSEALVLVYIKSLVATDHMVTDLLVTLAKEASLSNAVR